jgi:hypothetical protein
MSDESFYYPDGIRRREKPKDGEIFETISPKNGKATQWEYDEEISDWNRVPKGRTPVEIVNKAKKILQIAEFSNLRPAKKYYDHYYEGYEDEFTYGGYSSLYPHGPPAPTGPPSTGFCYPYGRSMSIPVVGPVRSAINDSGNMPENPPTITMIPGVKGEYHVPCECGATYTDRQHEHYEFCPRFPRNIRRY